MSAALHQSLGVELNELTDVRDDPRRYIAYLTMRHAGGRRNCRHANGVDYF
ncbi:hypothetical protein [Mycolicibacter icosiumassiliensis]|uniref:hypothetical protein n=1 Tax=Mycolicibacter icosiumassiliensis TaxID=1792835 RepID=UPI001AD84AD9|nr:hypothetical protein [Mycolicibacter icosiumassiliensis]